MVKKKSKKEEQVEEVEYSKPSATIEELHQECPKCKGDLLIKKQTAKEFQYKCYSCGYEENRERGKSSISEEPSKKDVKKKGE